MERLTLLAQVDRQVVAWLIFLPLCCCATSGRVEKGAFYLFRSTMLATSTVLLVMSALKVAWWSKSQDNKDTNHVPWATGQGNVGSWVVLPFSIVDFADKLCQSLSHAINNGKCMSLAL